MPRPKQKIPKWITIPTDKVLDMIGKRVHCVNAAYGCQWILKDVRNGRAILETPKTKKKLNVPISTLCYTNKHKPGNTNVAISDRED